jgi:osmotically-inducible protein OsmY
MPRVDADDHDIARDVEAQLAAAPATSPYDIEVSSHDGVVSLRGEVASHVERLAALAAAERVEGVTDTEDDLVVKAPEHRSDEEIREDIVSVLELEPETEAATIALRVEEGRVTLHGEVATLADKLRLARLVGVEGVTAIDADRLVVRPNATPAMVPPGYASPGDAHARIDEAR